MADLQTVRPASTGDLIALINDARGTGTRLALRGGGTKAGFGAPDQATVVDMRGFSGVVDYDPAELVLTVRPGTPLTDVEALLAAHGQMLAFEPFDHGPVYGDPVGAATIGGVIAAGVAGSRRVSRGATRDHLLGFSAVSGHGKAFVAGAKVTKNVTGYDLSKLACGSWGRLFAFTELHIKTLPRPAMHQTVALDGLTHDVAIAAMSRALGSQASVAAAAHVPQAGLTALRIEGFAPSVAVRQALLADLLCDFGAIRVLDAPDAQIVWDSFQTIAPLTGAPQLWRAVVPAARAAAMIDALRLPDAAWMMDWAGGLIWIGCDDTPAMATSIRKATEAVGGHADLVRASLATRQQCVARHPQSPALTTLETRVRRAFDPDGVFETGRFLDMC